jgi:hypothetical protein
MNTQAIERIKGYCCKVNEEQWEELVRVADEVGCEVGANSRRISPRRSLNIAKIDWDITTLP